MNFYKLSRLLKETGYDSQVVPGGQTVAQQPMQAAPQTPAQTPQQMPSQQTGTQANNQSAPVQAKDVNHLL